MTAPASIISESVEATIAAGRDQGRAMQRGGVIALVGDLGAGKTHFVKGIVAGLNSKAPVTSPTFTLIHEYADGRLPIYHFDFYRLNSAAEAVQFGLDDYLDGDGVCVIEWAERFPELLPTNTCWIGISIQEDGTRVIRPNECR